MVNIQYLALITLLGLVFTVSGCATNPFSSGPPARVEERTEAPPPSEKAQKPESVPAPVYEPLPESSPPVTIDEEKPEPTKSIEQKTGPAVIALLEDADTYAANGKQQQAVASLERALRIEPKNPVLWHKLSRLRLQEKNWEQAIALARKSNVLAPGNNSLQAENWLIIAKAKESQGDASGALKALKTAQQLKN